MRLSCAPQSRQQTPRAWMPHRGLQLGQMPLACRPHSTGGYGCFLVHVRPLITIAPFPSPAAGSGPPASAASAGPSLPGARRPDPGCADCTRAAVARSGLGDAPKASFRGRLPTFKNTPSAVPRRPLDAPRPTSGMDLPSPEPRNASRSAEWGTAGAWKWACRPSVTGEPEKRVQVKIRNREFEGFMDAHPP